MTRWRRICRRAASRAGAAAKGRRGRPQGSESMGEMHVIKAQVPLAEMLTYAPQLRSMTGGRGSFTMEFDHYEEVPSHLIEKIVADAKARKAADS